MDPPIWTQETLLPEIPYRRMEEASILDRTLDQSVYNLEKSDEPASILLSEDIRQHQALFLPQTVKFNLPHFILSFIFTLFYPIVLYQFLHKLNNERFNFGLWVIWGLMNTIYLIQILIIPFYLILSNDIQLQEFLQPFIGFFITALTLAIISGYETSNVEFNGNSPIHRYNQRSSDVVTYFEQIKNKEEPNLVTKRIFILIGAVILSFIYAGLIFVGHSINITLVFISMVNWIQAVVWFSALGLAFTMFSRRLDFAYQFAGITSSRNELPGFRLDSIDNIRAWLLLRIRFFTHGPRSSIDILFSLTLVVSLILILQLIIQTFVYSYRGGGYIVNLFLACILSGFSLMVVMCALKINKIFKDTSVLLAEKIYLQLKSSETQHPLEIQQCKVLLDDIIHFIESLQGSIQFAGYSITENFVHVILSLIVSGTSGILARLF